MVSSIDRIQKTIVGGAFIRMINSQLIIKSTGVITLGLLVLLGGAGHPAAASQDSAPVEATEEANGTRSAAADVAWEVLLSIDPGIKRGEGESHLAYFMRKVELSNQIRRSEGLQFWRHYPNDSRRYSWLIRTVYMPPAYPVDLEAWAGEETNLNPNLTARDHRARAQWDETYPALRETFWSSDDVDDVQRRMLWAGEIYQQIADAIHSTHLGKPVELHELLTAVLDWVQAYPEPFDSIDSRLVYYSYLDGLVKNGIANHAALLGVSEADLEWFRGQLFERLTAEGDRFDAVTGRWVDKVFPQAIKAIAESDSKRRDSKAELDTEAEATLLLSVQPRELHSFSKADWQTEDAKVVNMYRVIVGVRKHRDIGLRLAIAGANEEFVRSWWVVTHNQFPPYSNDFISTLQSNRDIALNYDDQVAWNDWILHSDRLMKTLLSSSSTTLMKDVSVHDNRLWSELRYLQSIWARTGDRSHLDEYLVRLDRALDLFGDYVRSEGEWPGSSTLSHILKLIGRNYEDYGLWREEAIELLSGYVEHPEARVRRRTSGTLALIRLEGQPFEFTGPTLDGEMRSMVDYRGKIVLVDHWDTGCSACIAAFPVLHEVYLDYKERGFEVVSIGYDASSERRRVLRIKNELGLTWTTLNGEGQWEEISNKYGFSGFPHYMLLDRDGKLYRGSVRTKPANLRILLAEMLAEETAQAP